MPKRPLLLTILYFNIFKIARYSSNIKICGCQYQRTFEPFITKVYELIRIEQFASDLRKSFPDIKGFSKRNVYAMRQWYLFYSDKFEFVPQAVAQIPWGHNRLIISRIKDIDKAVFYAKVTIENG